MYSIIRDRFGVACAIQLGEMSIPLDPRNRDFAEFLDWNAQQKSPLSLAPLEPPPPTEKEVQEAADRTALKVYLAKNDGERTEAERAGALDSALRLLLLR